MAVFIDDLKVVWRWIDWVAMSAIGTFLVAVVALLPIGIEYRRKKVQARNFRFRAGVRLVELRPSVENVVQKLDSRKVEVVLSVEDFRRAVKELESMMGEALVLKADEHKKFGELVANLVLAAPLYGSTLPKEIAQTILTRIDSTIKVFMAYGVLRGKEG